MQFRVIVVTEPPTHMYPQTGSPDRLQCTVPQLVSSVIKECDILGVKTYSDPSYIFAGGQDPQPLHDLCP